MFCCKSQAHDNRQYMAGLRRILLCAPLHETLITVLANISNESNAIYQPHFITYANAFVSTSVKARKRFRFQKDMALLKSSHHFETIPLATFTA